MAEQETESSTWKSLVDSQQWDAALQQLKKHPVDSANYYYNLGSVYLRLDKPGLSYAFLEKARARSPLDLNIAKASQMARERLGALIGEARIDPASDWVESAIDRIPVYGAEVAFSWLALAFIGITYGLHRKQLKQILDKRSFQLGALFSVLYFALAGIDYWGGRHPVAFIQESSTVRSGPADRFFDLGRLETGTKVRLTGSTQTNPVVPGETWFQIRHQDGEIAWIRGSSLLLL